MAKARPTRNAMRDLNPTISVIAVTEPLIWGNAMELVRGNDCVDARYYPRTSSIALPQIRGSVTAVTDMVGLRDLIALRVGLALAIPCMAFRWRLDTSTL